MTKEHLINQVEAYDGLVIVDFYSTWCGPCKILMAQLHKMLEEDPDKFTLIKIDVEQEKELTQELNIKGIPVLHFYLNGQLQDTSVGKISKEDLLARIEQNSDTDF